MPPLSNMRKSSAATTTMTMTDPPPNHHMSALVGASTNPRRTASGRAVRTNTTRPTNYYARPFASINTAAELDTSMPDSAGASGPGFYPGLQFFSDAVTALPKDVMRQFTLLKEVEAKLHGPQGRMAELLDSLLQRPVPARKPAAEAEGRPVAAQGLMSFTANNSVTGSAVPSVVNGVAGRHSAHASLTGSLNGDATAASHKVGALSSPADNGAAPGPLLNGEAPTSAPNGDAPSYVAAAGTVNPMWRRKESNPTGSVQPQVLHGTNPDEAADATWSRGPEATSAQDVKAATSPQLAEYVEAAPILDKGEDYSGGPAPAPAVEQDPTLMAQYGELLFLCNSMRPSLDEKNEVLSGANRIVAQQDMRIDSVWPQIEIEISEEARLGSMTHWAYSDNRQKKQTAGGAAVNRRDVAAANSLAAAASVVREADIAQARKEAGREAARERVKGRRAEAAGDSDFDDKPKKTQKLGRGKGGAAAAAAGLGISTNGEPATKRKKIGDKISGAMGIERTTSGPGRGGKARETPRSTPAIEPSGKKATKARPGPPPKRRLPNSAQASPMLASSPLAPTFGIAGMEPPGARPQSARLRANSSATNLRHEKLQDEDTSSRPSSAGGKSLEKTGGKRKAQDMADEADGTAGMEQIQRRLNDATEKLKYEDTDMPDAQPEPRPVPSRSGSSHKHSGRTSNAGTPRQDSFPGTEGSAARARNARHRVGGRGEGRDSSSSEPLTRRGSKHQRAVSNSHLVKQLAPFNRSPDLDRHRGGEDGDDDLESLISDAKQGEIADHEAMDEGPVKDDDETPGPRRPSDRRPPSRRNTATTMRSSPVPMSRESTPAASPPPPSSSRSRAQTMTSQATAPELEVAAEAEAEAEADAVVDEEEDDSEHDPDDPNEDKYCYCNRGSYGEMVACDNDNCPMEWFHLGCTELKGAPSKDEAWYCRECRPLFAKGRGTKSRGGGRG